MTSTSNEECIDLKISGELLLTRDRGKELRVKVSRAISVGRNVVFDFAGVAVVTPSFADEVFGDLVEEFGWVVVKERVRVVGASKQVKHLLAVVMSNRVQRAGPSPAV